MHWLTSPHRQTSDRLLRRMSGFKTCGRLLRNFFLPNSTSSSQSVATEVSCADTPSTTVYLASSTTPSKYCVVRIVAPHALPIEAALTAVTCSNSSRAALCNEFARPSFQFRSRCSARPHGSVASAAPLTSAHGRVRRPVRQCDRKAPSSACRALSSCPPFWCRSCSCCTALFPAHCCPSNTTMY